MPHSCPRPCGRLATAAVFVSVGVVQFIAGLILLKSKYVYLLSGPDFWTAASNLAVGALLGMSASVWKDVQKTSFKHVVRRNLLASLVVSAMIINSTTAIILILGEGNTLLSIQLENDGTYSSTSEILAYSYATSVCSPIVSVVVAIVFLSGMCFRVSDKGMKTPEIKSILKKNSISEYNWVYEGRQSPPRQDSKILRKELSFKSLSSSSDDESFSMTDAKLWSNSVNSIEYMNTSSRRGSYRTGIYRLSKVQQELSCECGEHVKHLSETIPHETSRVSFADDTKTGKFLKFSPYVSRSLLETDSPFYSDHIEAGSKIANSLSYAEFKKMHRHFENSKQRYKKKRMLLTEHPAFQQSKLFEVDMNNQSFHDLNSPHVHIPRAHTRMGSKPKHSAASEVKAEVHGDQEDQVWVIDENGSESQTIPCKDDVSAETVHRENLQFRRSSTLTQLNNSGVSQQNDIDSVDRKVRRTSTAAAASSSKVSHLDISDIQNDSAIDQKELYESEEEKDTSDVTSPPPTTPQNNEIEDSFMDEPDSNALAGEVVKVQVSSLPRASFHSKLIPVPIPIVSSVKKNTLKRKQRDPITKEPNKFSGRNELRFSSFYDDIKAINQGSRQIKADGENPLNEKSEAVDDTTVCEMSPEDNIPSPAQTSGYDSAIFENTHLSGSECFKPNLSSSDAKSPYYTPKRKFQNFPFPRNLDNV